MRKTNKIIKYLGLSFIVLILLLILLFMIDINKMCNNEPVFFSTWGFNYVPPVDLSDEKINRAVGNYLIKKNKSSHYINSKTFVSMETYLMQEKGNNIYLYKGD